MNHISGSRLARAAQAALVALALLVAMRPAPLGAARRTAVGRDAFQAKPGLVTTAVTVRERGGQLVSNLTQPDFVVQEDGRPQVITGFTSARTPLSVAMVIDTSQSLRAEGMQ